MSKPIIYATSDLHGHLPDPRTIPPCDIFLIAGDVTPVSNHSYEAQRQFFRDRFPNWLDAIKAETIIWTPGNHDFICEVVSDEVSVLLHSLPAYLLIDNGVFCGDLQIYGTPWTPTFGRWAFMRPESDLETIYGEIPPGIDILLSHGPPAGACDLTYSGNRAGSSALTSRIRCARPQAIVCGHIHEARGRGFVQNTKVYNVSHVNLMYEPVNPPVQILL